jgi:hypothetical protein
MNSRDVILREIRTQWFKDHVAQHQKICGLDGVSERLLWRDPENIHYAVLYHRIGRRLIVTGDIGDAIYWWSESHSMHWISQLCLSYFHSKCIASEVGRSFDDWSYEKAEGRIKEILDESSFGAIDRFSRAGGYEAMTWKDEWMCWCAQNAHEVFGDHWMDHDLGSIGRVIHPRCIGHLEGLKMAFEQIGYDPCAVKPEEEKPGRWQRFKDWLTGIKCPACGVYSRKREAKA